MFELSRILLDTIKNSPKAKKILMFASVVYGLLFLMAVATLLISTTMIDKTTGRIAEDVTRKAIGKIEQVKKIDPKGGVYRAALAAPLSFYYEDKEQVDNLCSQFLKTPSAKEVEETSRKSSGSSLGSSISWFSGEVSGSVERQTTEKYRSESRLLRFADLQQYLVDNNLLVVDVAQIKYDEKSLQDFREIANEIKTKFKFDIPVDVINKFEVVKKKEAILQFDKMLGELDSQKLILVKGEFSVKRNNAKGKNGERSNDDINLSMIHPVSDELSKSHELKDLGIKQIIFSGDVQKDKVADFGEKVFQNGKKVNMSCFAKLVHYDNKKHELFFAPLVIY